jgi:hypothetical protein
MDFLQWFQGHWWGVGGQGTTSHRCEGVEEGGELDTEFEGAVIHAAHDPGFDEGRTTNRL